MAARLGPSSKEISARTQKPGTNKDKLCKRWTLIIRLVKRLTPSAPTCYVAREMRPTSWLLINLTSSLCARWSAHIYAQMNMHTRTHSLTP